jgi:hypothetical protein
MRGPRIHYSLALMQIPAEDSRYLSSTDKVYNKNTEEKEEVFHSLR